MAGVSTGTVSRAVSVGAGCRSDPASASAVRPKSPALGGRRAGSFSIARMTKSVTSGGKTIQLDSAQPDFGALPAPGGTAIEGGMTADLEAVYAGLGSDADFAGHCQTFGPGDYAHLPWTQDRVASGYYVPERYSAR